MLTSLFICSNQNKESGWAVNLCDWFFCLSLICAMWETPTDCTAIAWLHRVTAHVRTSTVLETRVLDFFSRRVNLHAKQQSLCLGPKPAKKEIAGMRGRGQWRNSWLLPPLSRFSTTRKVAAPWPHNNYVKHRWLCTSELSWGYDDDRDRWLNKQSVN